MAVTQASRLLASARRRAGLTQRDLARRARTSQSVIARIECGAISPGSKTLLRLVSSAGFDLHVTLNPSVRGRPHMLADLPPILRLTPGEHTHHLRNPMPPPAPP